MTGLFFLDWGVVSVSLFNMITLFWLALTVILNSDRRRMGIWLAGAGMAMGSLFFAIHTTIIFKGFTYSESTINSLWSSGWTLLILLPIAWYVLILWYLGFWEDYTHYLQKRQKYPFYFTILLFFIVARYVLFTKTLPTFLEFANLDMTKSVLIKDIPLLIIIYPLYILMCIGLSIDALRFPGPHSRMMGDVARRRARPWLMASSLMLLLVSIMVTSFMLWVVFKSGEYEKYDSYILLYNFIGTADLIIESCISIAVLMLGQAITSYEIFTGNTLPRRGLFRNWLNVIFIAGGYSIVVGAGLNSRLSPFYYLIFTALIMTFFYALFNWRFYIERERYMSNLRPFITNQNIYENLLSEKIDLPDIDINTAFHGLCKNILETENAVLIPMGTFAPLIGGNIYYPDFSEEIKHLNEIVEKITSHEIISIPLSPENYNNFVMAVPLWSERGLTGILLIGKKVDSGLYSHEEIEIARSVSERLIDTKAGAEMAKWLMDFQRKRISETQLLDRKAKRILHDDVLPLLHTSLISLSADEKAKDAVNSITEAHHKISDLLHEMPSGNISDVNKLGMVDAIKNLLKHEVKGCFDGVEWIIEPEAEKRISEISPVFSEVIFYAVREAIRNSAKYGRTNNTEHYFQLTISLLNDEKVKIIIEDNGCGINDNRKSNGGSGQGLALHSTMMAVIGGTIILESEPEKYTKVTLVLP